MSEVFGDIRMFTEGRNGLFRNRLQRAMWQTAVTLLVSMPLISCRQPAKEAVTLRFPYGYRFEPDDVSKTASLTQQFTQQTGIQIQEMPAPENTFDQLTLWRELLKSGPSGTDLLGVDLIWSPILAPDLVDLGPELAKEMSSLDPQLLSGYTVNGKLVAIPYQVYVSVLEYRSDLLRKYGYDHPPRTWDELERMSLRIQSGERARGRKDFWGYVWQGAAREALTCNALEWQAAVGGGRIIETDRTISVNNPAAIRSWQRAKRWIGWISPPSVVAYQEGDTMNEFRSGRAAFNRIWLGRTISRGGRPLYWRNFKLIVETGFTNIPGGPEGSASTLGGSGLAISRYTAHPSQAIEFVRFLVGEQIQLDDKRKAAPEEWFEITNLSSIPDEHGDSRKPVQRGIALVIRPSAETGARYQEVSAAYAAAVHAVLIGEKGASDAAADLEKQLVQITGFSTGSPKKQN